MRIKKLSGRDFRCYESFNLSTDFKFNVFVGNNGQGKTSLLEAVSLLLNLKSFKPTKNVELIRFNQKNSLIEAQLEKDDLSIELKVQISSNRKIALLNNKPCKLLSEYIGSLASVSFCPSDLEIIRGSPELRRNWIDRFIQISDPEYTLLCSRFYKVLENRNKLLKNYSEGHSRLLGDDFKVWTEEFCHLGSKIIHKRIHSVDKVVDKINYFYKKISFNNSAQDLSGDALISICYLSNLFNSEDEGSTGHQALHSLEHLDGVLLEKASKELPKEQIVGFSLFGPQKDDLSFNREGHEFRSFGSQGEVRTLLLAMRMAEIKEYEDFRKVAPILIIDDFSSELDEQRRGFLLEYLKSSKSQVFISTTEEIELNGESFKRVFIQNGKVIPNKYGYTEYDRFQQL